jgi:hypothetical protein
MFGIIFGLSQGSGDYYDKKISLSRTELSLESEKAAGGEVQARKCAKRVRGTVGTMCVSQLQSVTDS